MNPALHSQSLLHRRLGGLRRVLPDHLLLRRGQRFRLLEETFHSRRVAIFLDQGVQRLNEVPSRRIHLRLEARMNIVRRPAAPLLPA